MNLTRKQQTTWLIILTAVTLMPSYSLQGWLASGHAASDLPFFFWIWETTAWSMRALIEAGAILYLFETPAQTVQQERALLGFKVALITLITLTLGPVVASAGLGQSIPNALPLPLFWLWSFAIASYAPLMLGSVGMAYRIHPHDAHHAPMQHVAPAEIVAPKRKAAVAPKPMPHDTEPPMPHVAPVMSHDAPAHVAEEAEGIIEQAEEIAALSSLYSEPETARLWDELGNDEARHNYYLEQKAMGLSDVAIAALLGVHRATLDRVNKKVRGVNSNGVHKEAA